MELKNKIRNFPLTSGVYLMKGVSGKIIYVGKAVSLRKRVLSYFRSTGHAQTKTDMLVSKINDICYIKTESEAEALILEASLIKKHRPKYNISLKDDKSYPYIEISGGDFPRVSLKRPKEFDKSCKYYGPYVNAKLIREALVIIRKIFPFCSCTHFMKRPCLNYYIGLCNAPCFNKVTKKEYMKNIKNIILILEGKKDVLLRRLRKDMDRLSLEKEFEGAALVRDQLQAVGALYSGTKDINYFKEAEQLQRALGLSKPPHRIEAFDISNIMGENAVGSMVYFLNGKPDKNNYRRFKIKDVKGIDDFMMIAEVVRRRYTRLKKEKSSYPDLIVIDGGKGQLSSAIKELNKIEAGIPIISLAKREEEIFLPKRRNSVKLQKDSLGLKLLQRIRDEAHRFAISYHKLLRKKKTFE